MQHLEVTQDQLQTVHQLLSSMNVNPTSTVCKAMESLIQEGSDMAKKEGDADARDAGLICAAQKVEHYEIATYGSLRTWAKVLGEHDAAMTLQILLDEEYEADNILDRLAEDYLNPQAVD
jgi:ferritin-like metal-binding protein YciE